MSDIRGLSFAALLTLLGSFAKADELQPCPFDLREAIELAETQLEDMYNDRVLNLEAGIGTVPAELGREVRDYLSHVQDTGATGSNALVAYISRESAVCALYIQTGLAAGGEQPEADLILLPRTATEIAKLIDTNIAELVAGGPQDARAPSPRIVDETPSRAALPLATRERKAGRPSGELLREIADVLFPGNHFKALDGQTASLSIVPALNIGNVPFAALDIDGDGQPLLAHTVINIEPSLKSVLDKTIYGWTPGLSNPVVVGNPDATSDPDWVFPPLPGAEKEAREVASYLKSNALIGASATKEALLDTLGKADYVHIAAHGLSDLDQPLDKGFLALTGGRLTAREIQQLSLSSKPLVVLSACQTALGSPVNAGIIGVSRAFLLAGATNVVSSLWNVDDEATAAVMIELVRNLDRVSPSQALRLAQLEARKTWPDPRIWSAFVVFGGRIVSAAAQ